MSRQPEDEAGRPSNAEELAFRLLAESLPQLVWTCRGDGPCDYLSPQWVAYTGVPAERQLGYRWLDQVHPDDVARIRSEWSSALAERRIFDVEFRIRRHDGAYRWFKTRAVPQLDADGEVARWFGTNTDIQELRDSKAELARLNRDLAARNAARIDAARAVAMELQEVAGQLALAQAITHTGSWSYEVDAQRVVWSPEIYRILRVPMGDEVWMQPDHQRARFRAESWGRLVKASARVLERGGAFQFEVELADDVDGRRIAIVRAQGEADASGRVRRLVGTLQDVTELVRARDERDAAAERMRLATSAAGIGVWEWVIGADTLIWDARMYALYGIPAGAPVRYRDWRDAVHPDDRVAAEAHVQSALAGREDFSRTFRVQGARFGERYVRAAAIVLRDPDGAPVRMVGVNWDVTAEMLAERLIEERASLLRRFIRDAPVAIAMLDRGLRYVEISDRWMSDYGLDRPSVLGLHHYEVFPTLPERWKEVHRKVLRGEVHRHDGDPFEQTDGSVIWLQWEARPWFESGGDVGGILLFTRDITNVMELQHRLQRQAEELQDAVARARELEKSRKDLLADVSHELRNPVAGILGLAALLAGEALPPAARQKVSVIHSVSTELVTILDDLLQHAAVEGKISIRKVDVALRSFLEELRMLVAPRAEAQGSQVALVVDEELPERVRLDVTRLREVLLNLLTNAVKHTKRGSIVLSARRGEEQLSPATGSFELCLEVRDTGAGMSSERLGALFRRYETGGAPEGTGIGLAISRHIVELLGGTLQVQSEQREGTTARVVIPVEQASAPRQPARAPATGARGDGRRLLVAEDDPILQLLLRTYLESAGYSATIVGDGEAALERLAADEGFDAVLLDARMPVRDGLSTAREVRARGFLMPIIFVTANAMEQELRECLSVGDDFVTKPFTLDDLLGTLSLWV